MDTRKVRDTARQWADPDHAPRQQAQQQVVAATGFSEAQVAYALNEQLRALAAYSVPDGKQLVGRYGVASEEAQPLAGLPEIIALLDAGAAVSLPTTGQEMLVRAFLSAADVALLTWGDEDYVVVQPVAGEGDDEKSPAAITMPLLLNAAVLDGKENEDAREALAEDILLYDGGSTRCVRIVWAPRNVSPDPFLDTFAQFRGRYPARKGLAPRVRMMAAFAAKAKLPLAILDDYSLLVTRGEPEVQRAGHVRWVVYDEPAEITRWQATCTEKTALFARRGFKGLQGLQPFGEAHRPGAERFETAWQAVQVQYAQS